MRRNKQLLYRKKEPDRAGKLYFIFCEGEIKETHYFYFFNRITSQIVVQIVPIKDGKNSPMGLYNNACKQLNKTSENPTPNYELREDDEVWFIIDTDKWDKEIEMLRTTVGGHPNWYVGQSNPSFEVWLYYHFHKAKPVKAVSNWKEYINKIIPGGFNLKKHPAYVETAITNAEINFQTLCGEPALLSTELFILCKRLLPLIKTEIDALLEFNK